MPAAPPAHLSSPRRRAGRRPVELGPGADWDGARTQLAPLPGIGPWTVETIAMRALGDPDAFLPGDLGVRRAAADARPGRARPARSTGPRRAWRPWRAYAVQHLWATGDHPVNQLPDTVRGARA